nr:family 43 glycosylhydrolase [Paraflavitalea speifideiaquila]
MWPGIDFTQYHKRSIHEEMLFCTLCNYFVFDLLQLFSHVAQAQSITLVNPVLKGFYPDPSIVKVETDYYLVNSTFRFSPACPSFTAKTSRTGNRSAVLLTVPASYNS